MVNRLFVLFLLAGTMSFTCGCERPEPEPIELADLEKPALEPAVEPSEAEPEPVPVEKPEKVPVEPMQVKPSEAEPVDADEPLDNPLYKQWAHLLSTYVDDKGMVKYKVLRRKRAELAAVLRQFGNVTLSEYDSWDEAEKIAFWINAYNLCTLKIVIDHYPIKPSKYKLIFGYPANSVYHIPKPWTGFDFQIMREKYTLREIERGVLLRQFDDARICFALCYATLGGATLRNEPYTGPELDKQLDEQARGFISSAHGFKINRAERTVYLGAILKDSWYGNYFISRYGTQTKFTDKKPSERALLNFISNYISRKDKELLVRKDYSIKYIKYDWTLNGQ